MNVAVRRGVSARHAYVSFVDHGYREIGLNWIATAPRDVLEATTIFTTDMASLTALKPVAVRAHLPRRYSTECQVFHSKWLLKHAIVLAVLLEANRTKKVDFVTWFDIDCLILKPYHSWLNQKLARLSRGDDINLFAQRGTHPRPVYERVGATICLGLFTVRPSAVEFYESFWSSITEKPASSDENSVNEVEYRITCREDDQWAFNVHVEKWMGLNYSMLVKNDLNVDSELVISNELGVRTDRQIITAFLPYAEFPRGLSSELNITEFQQLRDKGARVWHMGADKIGESKKSAMKRDGVWLLRVDPENE